MRTLKSWACAGLLVAISLLCFRRFAVVYLEEFDAVLNLRVSPLREEFCTKPTTVTVISTLTVTSTLIEMITVDKSLATLLPDEDASPNASTTPKEECDRSWGLGRILDPLRDLVFVTIVLAGERTLPQEFHTYSIVYLRELVGSIHQWRPLASQRVPLIYVFGHRLQRREIEEISLWRNVIYQDLRHALPGISIFEGDQVDEGKNQDAGNNSTGKAPSDHLFPLLDERSLQQEVRDEQSLRLFLLKRIVEMHGHAIYVQTDQVFTENCFATLQDTLQARSYFQLVQREEGRQQVVCEGYLADSLPFHCQVLHRWDRTLSTTQTCQDWQATVTSALELGLEPVPRLIASDEHPLMMCHICIRDDCHHGWRFFKKHRIQPSSSRKNNRAVVAIGVPATSKRTREFWSLPLLSIFLPSLAKSLSERDRAHYTVRLYIGVDDGDRFYDNREHLRRLMHKTRRILAEVEGLTASITFVRLGVSQAVTYIWNVLFSVAIAEGAEYFYQANDDLHFKGLGWMHPFVSKLRENGNFGVVGPNDSAFDCRIMTQTMVSRTHWHLFGWYFPPEIRNWQCDTWITLVYAMHVFCFNKMLVWNGRYGQLGHLPRYIPCRSVDFRSLALHYQQRLRGATGQIDPKIIPLDTFE